MCQGMRMVFSKKENDSLRTLKPQVQNRNDYPRKPKQNVEIKNDFLRESKPNHTNRNDSPRKSK